VHSEAPIAIRRRATSKRSQKNDCNRIGLEQMTRQSFSLFLLLTAFLAVVQTAAGGVGDPQIRTDHPWYPGELSCSTFDRLFATQAELYERVTGKPAETDEQRAIAAWLWRNTHYWHGEEGTQDLWGKGFQAGGDLRTREYWTGLFADGFGLCGTTHSQWTVELQELLGHCRSRGVGVDGHNALEVFLTGGNYGRGRWALLDHDLSCVVFDESGRALCSIRDISKQLEKLTDRRFKPERQQGWLISGLHPGDAAAYRKFEVAEYLPGYAGPPPMVHLRRGERLRRYLKPGLEDGKTFVFWGRNYRTSDVPGPERSLTWVNQPDTMFGSKTGPRNTTGQARFANAVYTYTPNFLDGTYREALATEDGQSVTFQFNTPYIIAATPAADGPWDIYQPGCRNGLVLRGTGIPGVELSVDGGRSWASSRRLDGELDLTDAAKGHRQYLLRLRASAKQLQDSNLTITTVCQANSSTIPRLVDDTTRITFAASGQAVTSAGPTIPHARQHLVAGDFGKPEISLRLAAPPGQPVRAIYAAAHAASGNPPQTDVSYAIDYRLADSNDWKPIVKDWSIEPLGDQPKDFWSQSFCYGSAETQLPPDKSLDIRFSNTGRRSYLRAEAHLIYEVPRTDKTKVTFCWTDDAGKHDASTTFDETANVQTFELKTGKNVVTNWVELEAIAAD
jgi:hypothetical protein